MHDQAELIARLRRGDNQAFDSLVHPHLQRAFRTAYLITHDPDNAADALREGLVRVYRSLGNELPETPFYPWFARIVVNEAIKQVNKNRRRSFSPLPEQAELITPERVLLDHEERERLWLAVQGLSADHRASG